MEENKVQENQTFTAEQMEQMFPGFKEKIEEVKVRHSADADESDGITIGGRHYTAEQLDWMSKHPQGQRKKWTAAEKKAKNKKNKAASKQRRKKKK